MEKVKELRVHSSRQLPKAGDKECHPGVLHVPNPITRGQTLSPTEKEKRILENCQWTMERGIVQIVWSGRVKNAEVQQRTGESDVLVVPQTLKWKWEGHVARTDHRRWAHATPIQGVTGGTDQTSGGLSLC